jgi:hypothetical protein
MLVLEQKKPAPRARSADRQRQEPGHGGHPGHASPGPARAPSCACGGSCPRCQARSALAIGVPDDASERQADAAADGLLRMPARTGPAASAMPGVNGARASPVRAQDRVPGVAPGVDAAVRSGGQALDGATRSFFESGFGHDFSGVRLHSDATAARSARDLNALAYTVGRDIVFDSGQMAPQTREGRHLLAHELAHVVQQSGAGQAQTLVQRRVRPENVTCHETGLTNPDLTGAEVLAALAAADAGAIDLARTAEDELAAQLTSARTGGLPDPDFDTILQEEFSLTLSNPDHFGPVQQLIDRFRRVRTTLESGYLRTMCRGGANVSLVGCTTGSCPGNFAFSCPGNRLVVLCQAFWDTPDERAGTLLHEPFHIWFHMARHQLNALKRADASCYESFALRVSNQPATSSCATHTAG